MFLAPAAMFAMFYFLSQYIQNVMGYSPLKAGVAFLPFTVGIVVGAGLASNLVNRINPRYIVRRRHPDRGAARCFGFSTLPVRHVASRPATCVGTYVADILPFVVMMAFGMGLTFVPVTLTAVHHLRPEESGIGSGVLNTAAAGRWRAGPRRPRDGRDADLHRPGQGVRRGGRAAARSRRPSRPQAFGRDRRSSRSSPRARPTRSWSARS